MKALFRYNWCYVNIGLIKIGVQYETNLKAYCLKALGDESFRAINRIFRA